MSWKEKCRSRDRFRLQSELSSVSSPQSPNGRPGESDSRGEGGATKRRMIFQTNVVPGPRLVG